MKSEHFYILYLVKSLHNKKIIIVHSESISYKCYFF